MISLGIFFAVITTLSAQVPSRLGQTSGQLDWQKTHLPSSATPNSVDTVIENKNVNIIVNVDPKDVARELWLLLQSRLENGQGRRSMPRQDTLDELERIVTPVIRPTRRNHYSRAQDVAVALDRVTRSAILASREPTIDDEIEAREIVARMLLKLKLLMDLKQRMGNAGIKNSRRSYWPNRVRPNAIYIGSENPTKLGIMCDLPPRRINTQGDSATFN